MELIIAQKILSEDKFRSFITAHSLVNCSGRGLRIITTKFVYLLAFYCSVDKDRVYHI